MRNALVLIASVFIAGVSSLPAHAQWDNYGYNGTVVRCESRDGRTERCNISGGDVQLVRQLSGSPCIRGRNWGTDYRGLWVSSGCRGEFRVQSGGYDDYNDYDDDDDDRYSSGYGNDYGNDYGNGYGNDGVFRCESGKGRTVRCDSAGGRAELVRQLSNTPCVRGQSWGSDSRGVWVSNGCRALFRAGGYGNGYGNGQYGSDLLRCESRDNRSHSCSFADGRRGEIRLLRQLSGKPCIENQTWGRSRNGVWVTRGCRAEFVIGRGRGNGNGNGGGNPSPPGDLGGVPGGKQSGVFQDTSDGREPGDLGRAATPRALAEEPQRPPGEAVAERPRSDAGTPARPRILPVEEATASAPARPVEAAPGLAPPPTTGGSAQPGVEDQQPAPRARNVEEQQPAPREPGVEQGQRPH